METSKLKSRVQYMYVHWKNSEAMIYSIHMLPYREDADIHMYMYIHTKLAFTRHLP